MTELPPTDPDAVAEHQIDRWRSYLVAGGTLSTADVEELEDHLRGQMTDLEAGGLAPDESFLVAVKRLGAVDELSREFAREHSERLWKQLVLTPEPAAGGGPGGTGGGLVPPDVATMIGFALAAAAAIKVPELFGIPIDGTEDDAVFYARNVSLFVLPILTWYFVKRREVGRNAVRALVAVFVLGAIAANAYPFEDPGHTEILTALHLPIVGWTAVGVAYTGGRWRSPRRRMDFIRFTGEWFVYFSLLAMGGVVLILFTLGAFEAIGLSVEVAVTEWILPCGAMGAVIVAAWLVEAKQGVIENMAPVLTRVFTPLFAILLLVLLGGMALQGEIDADRDVLIFFDLLLVVVLGLLLYSLSARDPLAPPSLFDGLQLLLVVAALVVDVVVLGAILSRISDFGFSANKVAALGENLVLLVNLGWSAWLSAGFLRGRRRFADLERWQTAYLPVYGLWAAFVVVLFPPIFGFE